MGRRQFYPRSRQHGRGIGKVGKALLSSAGRKAVHILPGMASKIAKTTGHHSLAKAIDVAGDIGKSAERATRNNNGTLRKKKKKGKKGKKSKVSTMPVKVPKKTTVMSPEELKRQRRRLKGGGILGSLLGPLGPILGAIF